MNEEEKKATEIVKNITEKDLLDCWDYGEKEYKAIQIVLNLIEKQQKEITHWKSGMQIVEKDKNNHIERLEKELDKKDKIIRKIIQRLENDIQNITKTKADGHTDDYRRCRLKAYKTKTREVKEYIEKEYFTKKVETEDK